MGRDLGARAHSEGQEVWYQGRDMLMLQQVGALPEALATLCKGLFPCVHPAVLLQAAAVYKALATVKAYKRPLLSVCELVAQQVRAVTEAVATLAAHEWSLTCVDLLMPQQVAALAEHFATHVTTVAWNFPRSSARAASSLTFGGVPYGGNQSGLAGFLTCRVLLTSQDVEAQVHAWRLKVTGFGPRGWPR